MPDEAPEVEFHRLLFTRLRDHVHGEQTPFDSVSIETSDDRRRATVAVESEQTGSVAIEVERDSVYPISADVVDRARTDADATDAVPVATCNSNDFFLFQSADAVEQSEIPYYYLNLRDIDLQDPTLEGIIPRIVDAMALLTTEGTLPPQAARERVVGLLRSFHDAIWPTFRALAGESYDTDSEFRNRFDEWIHENDYGDLEEREQFSLAAKQYAYLIANKILFYEVIREQTPDPIATTSGRPLDSLVDDASGVDTECHIREQFERVQDEIGYEPVFDETASLFDGYPHNPKTRTAVENLLASIEAGQLVDVEEDLLGELYEELIPPRERKALGQFYTHPDIATAICNWTIQPVADGVPRVLDPASGSGTFTVEAYHRMQELSPASTHQELLDNLFAVDINRFPLHLTALNLSTRNVQEQTDELHTFNESFFSITPQDGRIRRQNDTGDELGSFDAVVGNPPFIRQENLYPDKEHFRSHLDAFGPANSSPYRRGQRALSKQSDAYVYFVTHALQFLREGGRLGFIVPTKWLTTKYGESFQEFLYDHAKVHAIVGFADRAFAALVDTVVLFLERCDDERARRETTTDFVRITDQLSPDALTSVVETERAVPDGERFEIETAESHRVVSVPQRRLEAQGGQKLGYCLYGPAPFVPLVNSDKMQRLDAFADVAFGNKTGNNGFFLLDEADVAQWGIDERFLKPAIRSIRTIDSLRLEDTDEYLLDFATYVETVRASRSERQSTSDLAADVKAQLRADGYHSVLRYIEHGEHEGVPDGRTVSQHTPWFNLGHLLVPDVLHPVFYNERVFTVDNAGGYAPTNAIQCVDITDHGDVLPAILNSTIYRIMLELWGRHEGGGALQLLTYEVSSVPVPNPALMAPSERRRVARAGKELVQGVERGQRKLDEALLEFLEVDLSVEELQAVHRELMTQRVTGAATENVMITDVGDFDSSIPGCESDWGQNDNPSDV